MARKNKNLLEAFSASQSEEKVPDTDPSLRKGPARVAGPFATSRANQEPPIQAAGIQGATPDWLDRFLSHPVSLPVAMLLLGVLLGRASVGNAAEGASPGGAPPQERQANPASYASGGEDRYEPAPAATPAPSVVPREPQVPQIALYDTENRYTIVAAHYKASKEEIAWGAYEYLEELGFEVFPLYKDASGDWLFLFVGAAPIMSHLDKTLERLKSTPGPNGNPGDFATAQMVPIDKYVDDRPQ